MTGTVSYLQRIALPPSAVVEVRLEDVSRADAPAVTIAEQAIKPEGKQVPFPFELCYEPTRIKDRGRYVSRVRIVQGAKLLFTNTNVYPVITGGHPNSVNVIVKPIPGDARAMIMEEIN